MWKQNLPVDQTGACCHLLCMIRISYFDMLCFPWMRLDRFAAVWDNCCFMLILLNNEMGFNHTFFFCLFLRLFILAGWLMWKHFQHLRRMKGGGIQTLLVSVPLSVAVWAFPTVCARACVCLHCPRIGSDDSTMLTSQDALTLNTLLFYHFLTAKRYVRRPVSLRWCDGWGESELWAGVGVRQAGQRPTSSVWGV